MGPFTCIRLFRFRVALLHLYRAFHFHMSPFTPVNSPLPVGVTRGVQGWSARLWVIVSYGTQSRPPCSIYSKMCSILMSVIHCVGHKFNGKYWRNGGTNYWFTAFVHARGFLCTKCRLFDISSRASLATRQCFGNGNDKPHIHTDRQREREKQRQRGRERDTDTRYYSRP